MSKELIVATGRHETRVAILEDDQLVEVFHEREKEYSLAGSIHKGRVTRVLPGMQSAFVDIGLERDAFLYVSDFFEDNDEYDAVVSTAEDKVLKFEKSGELPVPVIEISGETLGEARATEAPAQRAAGQQQPQREARPERTGGDQNRDRGGRGRRGRRRGGRGPGGLPDSKYFTPGNERSSERQPERHSAPQEVRAVVTEAAEETHQAEPEVFERFVLPGES